MCQLAQVALQTYVEGISPTKEIGRMYCLMLVAQF